MREQDLRADPVGLAHRVERRIDPAPPRAELRMRRKQRAGTDRLGQQQHVARAHAALAQHRAHGFVDQAVDRKPHRQLRALARVPAHESATGRIEDFDGPRHHLRQYVLDLGLQTRRHGDDRRRGLRFCPHREDVAQRMVRRDLAEDVWIVDERTEEIHRVHHRLAGRHAYDCGVVGRMQPDQDIGALYRMQPAQRARQHCRADLGPAPAAAHGDRRQRLRRLLTLEPHRRSLCGSGLLHRGKLAEPAHEAAVNPVFPAPDPGALEIQSAARGDSVFVPGADQGQPVALRPISPQRPPFDCAAQVLRQRRPLAHRKHARLFARLADHRRDVSRSEDLRIRHRLQRVLHFDETGIVQREARVTQPGRA